MEDPRGTSRPLPDDDAHDIEIVEVVGLEEDSPAAAVVEEEEDADDAVEIVFDDREAADPTATPELDQLRERHLRLQAEFDNFRKRSARERSDHELHASAGLVERLLPVLDNFERALAATALEGGDTGFAEGVEMIQRQLTEELRREGLKVIESVGRPFDPEVHEAVSTACDPDAERETVLEEIQRGYFFHDRLLRPALVCVNVPERDADAEAPDDEDDEREDS